MLLQRQLFGPQDIEHRGRIGGGDDRADEKALQPGQLQCPVGKGGHQRRRPRHPQGGENYRLDRHRPGSRQVGTEAAVKHDEDQTDRADQIDGIVVIKINAQQPVFSKAHSQCDEDQQGWDRQAVQEPPHQGT